jgi:hypothetical protein
MRLGGVQVGGAGYSCSQQCEQLHLLTHGEHACRSTMSGDRAMPKLRLLKLSCSGRLRHQGRVATVGMVQPHAGSVRGEHARMEYSLVGCVTGVAKYVSSSGEVFRIVKCKHGSFW